MGARANYRRGSAARITASMLVQLIVAINIVVIGCGLAIPGNASNPEHGRAAPAVRGDSAEHAYMNMDRIQSRAYNSSSCNGTCVAEWVSAKGSSDRWDATAWLVGGTNVRNVILGVHACGLNRGGGADGQRGSGGAGAPMHHREACVLVTFVWQVMEGPREVARSGPTSCFGWPRWLPQLPERSSARIRIISVPLEEGQLGWVVVRGMLTTPKTAAWV